MLQNLSHDLPLGAGIFLPHRPVHQLHNILVEVGDEVFQVLFVGFIVQAFSPNPFHGVSVYNNVRYDLDKEVDSLLYVAGFYLIRQSLVSQIRQQLRRFGVQTPVDDVDEQGRLLQVLQVDVVDVPDVGETVVLRVLHVEYAVDHLPFSNWKWIVKE